MNLQNLLKSPYKLLLPICVILFLWYFSESISLTLNLNSFNVKFYPIYPMIISQPLNHSGIDDTTVPFTSAPTTVLLSTMSTSKLTTTTTSTTIQPSTTAYTNSSLKNISDMYLAVGWATSMGWGNLMFQYASLLGLCEMFNRTPAVDSTPLYPLKQIFALNITEVVNHTWSGVGELCCCCFKPVEYSKLDPAKDYKISGYLQSFKYFANFSQQLKTKDFRFNDKLTSAAKQKQLELLSSYCSNYNQTAPNHNCSLIGIHVRRGDITAPHMHDYGYIVADRAYLLRAIDHFRQKITKKQLIFIVIGNDYKWNQQNLENLTDDRVTIALLPTSASELDLALLSASDHLIMTTGTYGWWAGYLCGGTVVYHKIFARNGSYLASQMVAEDHFPPEWVPL